MEKILLKSDQYNGKYIAMPSIEDTSVVGCGESPEQAIKEANKKGFNNPYILYIPENDVVHIYEIS